MIKLISICKCKKFHIQILGLLCLCLSQSIFAESSLQKSLLELKKVIQEQTQKASDSGSQSSKVEVSKQNANVDDVFGIEVPKQQVEPQYYWKSKAELFDAVTEDRMPEFTINPNSNSNRLIAQSIAKILATDYQTPVQVERNYENCTILFVSRVPYLMGLITKSKSSKLGSTPPNFVGNDDNLVEANNAQGRLQFKVLSDQCSREVLGLKTPYPFVSSLSALLKEYSQITEKHVDKLRIGKIEAYKVAEEKARIAKVEKDSADSEAKVLENQASEKLLRDRQFQDEFNRKEETRKAQCLSSIAYARFISATTVQENLSRVKSAKDSILKEKEIGKVSGYEDAGKLNELGRIQIFAQDNVNSAYKDYRKNGGNATSPANVIAGKNPCL